MEVWLHPARNGTLVESFLPQHIGAILCSMGQWTESGKYCWYREDPKIFCKAGIRGRLQKLLFFIKKLMLEPLYQRRKMLQLKFIKNTLSNGFFSDLFPKNSKKHKMETIHQEKYKVTHANTTRFQNSPIIVMQKMLNKDT